MKTTLQRFAFAGFILAQIFVANAFAWTQDWSNPARARWIKQAPIPTWFNLQGVAALSPNEC
jgi:hypothetical protein